MNRNFWMLVTALCLALVARATGEGSTVVFAELDVTQDVDYWKTTGHANPTVSQATASLADVAIAVSGDAASGDYLTEHAFDTRTSFEPKTSGSISFTSEPPGLALIVR